jgi:ankyrin repeat protein
MLFRPVDYYNGQRRIECLECFKLILARCGPRLRAAEHAQSMLHRVVDGNHGIGVELATILLDAGASLSVRDKLLMSTPLGWACRWGRGEMVKLFLARGADPLEADVESWATLRAWAEKMQRREIVELLTSARPAS